MIYRQCSLASPYRCPWGKKPFNVISATLPTILIYNICNFPYWHATRGWKMIYNSGWIVFCLFVFATGQDHFFMILFLYQCLSIWKMFECVTCGERHQLSGSDYNQKWIENKTLFREMRTETSTQFTWIRVYFFFSFIYVTLSHCQLCSCLLFTA